MKAAWPSRFLYPLIIYPLSPILAKPMLAFNVLNFQMGAVEVQLTSGPGRLFLCQPCMDGGRLLLRGGERYRLESIWHIAATNSSRAHAAA